MVCGHVLVVYSCVYLFIYSAMRLRGAYLVSRVRACGYVVTARPWALSTQGHATASTRQLVSSTIVPHTLELQLSSWPTILDSSTASRLTTLALFHLSLKHDHHSATMLVHVTLTAIVPAFCIRRIFAGIQEERSVHVPRRSELSIV